MDVLNDIVDIFGWTRELASSSDSISWEDLTYALLPVTLKVVGRSVFMADMNPFHSASSAKTFWAYKLRQYCNRCKMNQQSTRLVISFEKWILPVNLARPLIIPLSLFCLFRFLFFMFSSGTVSFFLRIGYWRCFHSRGRLLVSILRPLYSLNTLFLAWDQSHWLFQHLLNPWSWRGDRVANWKASTQPPMHTYLRPILLRVKYSNNSPIVFKRGASGEVNAFQIATSSSVVDRGSKFVGHACRISSSLEVIYYTRSYHNIHHM